METYPRPEVWQDYDCQSCGIDYDLHDRQLVYKGQEFACAGCNRLMVAGVDVDLQTGVDVLVGPGERDYEQRQFVDLPESAEALRQLVKPLEGGN